MWSVHSTGGRGFTNVYKAKLGVDGLYLVKSQIITQIARVVRHDLFHLYQNADIQKVSSRTPGILMYKR